MAYGERFKAQMVQKLADPQGPSASRLAKQVGVPQSTLSRWLRRAGTLPAGTVQFPSDPHRTGMTGKRPQDWTAEEKLQLLIAAAAVPAEELGAFLRRQGLHEAQLQQWRQRVLSGLAARPAAPPKGGSADARRVRELERELARKDKALAETAALLVLEKKVRRLWGDGDDDTGKQSGSRS